MWFFQGLLMNQYPPEYFYALISLFRITCTVHLSGSPNNCTAGPLVENLTVGSTNVSFIHSLVIL